MMPSKNPSRGFLTLMAAALTLAGDLPVHTGDSKKAKMVDFRPLTARERRQAKTTARHPHWHSRNRKQQSV